MAAINFPLLLGCCHNSYPSHTNKRQGFALPCTWVWGKGGPKLLSRDVVSCRRFPLLPWLLGRTTIVAKTYSCVCETDFLESGKGALLGINLRTLDSEQILFSSSVLLRIVTSADLPIVLSKLCPTQRSKSWLPRDSK